jgi:hypothetical protein
MKSYLKVFVFLGSVFAFYSAEARVRHTTVWCESISHRYRECRVEGEIVDAAVRRQLSGASCRYGRSWGVRHGWRNDALWVDNGCRAQFDVWVRLPRGHWSESYSEESTW